jgi:hypothetical protein
MESQDNSTEMALPIMAEVGEIDPTTSEEIINDYNENISEVPPELNDAEDALPDESLENIPEDQHPVTQQESDDLNEGVTLEDPIEETSQSELDVASNPHFENPELMDDENTGDQWEPEVTQAETVPILIKQRKQPKKLDVYSDRHKTNDAVESEKLIPRKPSNFVRNKLKMSEAFRLATRDTTPKYGRSRSDTLEEAEELRRQYYNQNQKQQKFRCDCGCDCDCHNEDNNRRMVPVQLPINVTTRYDSNGYPPVVNVSLQLPNSIPGDVQPNLPCSLKVELEF